MKETDESVVEKSGFEWLLKSRDKSSTTYETSVEFAMKYELSFETIECQLRTDGRKRK